jgi:hypothetical protein
MKRIILYVDSDDIQINVTSLEEFDNLMRALNEKRVDVAKQFAGKPIKNYTGSALYKDGILHKVKEGYEKSLLEQKGANMLLKDGMYKAMIGMAPWNCGFDLGKPLTVYDNNTGADNDIDKKNWEGMTDGSAPVSTLGDIKELKDRMRKLETSGKGHDVSAILKESDLRAEQLHSVAVETIIKKL